MTKEQAQKETIKRFTNLLDGKTLPFVSVATILNHYELLLNDFTVNTPSHDAIIQNFNKEWIKQLENEIEDIKKHIDGVDQYDDEQIDKYYQEQYAENQARELDEEMKMLEDLYGQDEPDNDDYPFDITNNRSDNPEYIIASTSYKMEETYIFEANEKGEILDFGEYGGLCKRHGDQSWNYRDYAVDVIFPGKYERVKDLGETGHRSDVFHSLYKRIDNEKN